MPTETDSVDPQKLLEEFVVNNDDLLELESRIGRFNIFDALGITRTEIRHSNFLAFILDPAESHGQGQLFLKAILMDLLKNTPSDFPLSPIDLDGTDLRGVEVRREWRNIDLLITCKDPRFVVVVENKVDSGEHSNQLSRYQKIIREQYPQDRPLYIFLTPDGTEPSETEDAWLPYSYEDIHRVLKRVRHLHHGAIGDDVLLFLDHYLNLLETRIMNDEKLDELCRRIYKNHRKALELIWDRVGNPGSEGFAKFKEVLDQDVRWEIAHQSGNSVSFLPKAWLVWLPPLRLEGEDRRRWILIDLRAEGWIYHDLWIGPMTDTVNRAELVAKLREEVVKVGLKRARTTKIDPKWARITAMDYIVELKKGEEIEPEVIEKKAKKALDELYSKLEQLAGILKPLCSVS